MNSDKKVFEIQIHGRGGQGAVTAAELLCEIAFNDGFKDVLSVPIIGAERRGAPIRANARLSPMKEIKTYGEVKNPDVTLIFDTTLLSLPGVLDSIKKGIVILNTHENIDISKFPSNLEIYSVNATEISIQLKLVVAGSPVLNVPMLGAYAKVMGHIKLETIKKVLEEKFGAKAELNYTAAAKCYENVKKLR